MMKMTIRKLIIKFILLNLIIGCSLYKEDNTSNNDKDLFIQAISPVNRAYNVPITTNFLITFSEQMDTNSVENAFSLSDGTDVVSGTYSWNGNMMTFNPSSDLSYSAIYYVAVGTGAMDTAGNNMASDFN